MPTASSAEPDSDLPPPGSRSGVGAQSVLPYLTKSLQAKPAPAPDHRGDARPGGETVFTNGPPSAA